MADKKISQLTAVTAPLAGTEVLPIVQSGITKKVAKPVFALIIAEGAPVRWRDDGTAPTASVGMPLAVGVPLQYDGDLTKIRFIEQSASAKLNISYYS